MSIAQEAFVSAKGGRVLLMSNYCKVSRQQVHGAKLLTALVKIRCFDYTVEIQVAGQRFRELFLYLK